MTTQSLYERLVEMIGVNRDGLDLSSLEADLGKAKVIYAKKRSEIIEMDSVTLMFGQNELESVFFHFATKSVEVGETKPYIGSLIGGIVAGDKRDEVRAKLGIEPFQSLRIPTANRADPQDYWDSFKLAAPLEITLIFDGHEQRLGAASVHRERPAPTVRVEQKLTEDFLQRFTVDGRSMVLRAQDEARRLRFGFIGSEHLLMALMSEPASIAGQALAAVGAKLEEARALSIRICGEGQSDEKSELALTPGALRFLELSKAIALKDKQSDVETHHVLLAIIEEDEGVAARILELMKVKAERLRKEILKRCEKAE